MSVENRPAPAGHTSVTALPPTLSRRAFLATTGSALVGAMALGLTDRVAAGQQHPPRGGVLRFATRGDAIGLDPHRHALYPVSMPLAAITQGLIDLDHRSEPVPGIAAGWEVSHDLLTYTFRLRTGVLFHNGREAPSTRTTSGFQHAYTDTLIATARRTADRRQRLGSIRGSRAS